MANDNVVLLPEGVVCAVTDRKSTRLNSSHDQISYAVFCLKKKKNRRESPHTGKAERVGFLRYGGVLAIYRFSFNRRSGCEQRTDSSFVTIVSGCAVTKHDD